MDEGRLPADADSAPAARNDAPAPVVRWEPPATPSGVFTIAGVLRDVFARYGGDPYRLIAACLPPVLIGLLVGVAVGTPIPNPANLGAFFGATLLLSVLSLVVGLASASVVFALLEVGPRGSFGDAIAWGISRFGWLFATALLLGAIAFATFIPGFVLVALAAAVGGLVAFAGFLVLFVVLIWLFMRLALVVPAVVVDRLTTGEAIRLVWAATRPTGVWLRLLGAVLLLGLLIAPAEFLVGGLALLVPEPKLVAQATGYVLLAFLSPLATILYYAAYRRLVPPRFVSPVVDSATSAPIHPTVEEAPGTSPAMPTSFDAPPLRTSGRAIFGVTLALALVGVVTLPLIFGRILSGISPFPGGSIGNVPRGSVVFGLAGSLQTCTVIGQLTVAQSSDSIIFMGHLDHPATTTDEVRLLVSRDGVVLTNEVEQRGNFECLGTTRPETNLTPGAYEFQMFVNGQVAARGSLVVH